MYAYVVGFTDLAISYILACMAIYCNSCVYSCMYTIYLTTLVRYSYSAGDVAGSKIYIIAYALFRIIIMCIPA